MSKHKPPCANVMEFLRSSTDTVGQALSDPYEIDMFSALIGGEITSPIEQLFYMAFHAIVIINKNVAINAGKRSHIKITPQKKIGKYRVDFLVSLSDLKAVIELDGHNFHDKNEKQRRYEKQRDRFLQAKGYRVFHFTGKEITDDPYKSACEILAFLIELDVTEELYPFNYIGN